MKIVMLGEQATGKSSLLVALYGALVNRRAGEMRIVRTIDEVEFLSRGLSALGRGESVRRTEVDGNARLLVDVSHNDAVVSIELPDRSGELLKHMIDGRIWDPDLHHQLHEAAAAMLFLRADLLERSAVRDLEPIAPPPDPAADPAAPPPPPQPWSPSQMPPDVRAVDLLQAILEERPNALPLVVMLSAWDRISAHSPSVWLADNVPLLAQFLETHSGQLPNTVYGVSAQGADFSAPASAGEREDPWDRAFLVGPDGGRGTLADPIVWMIEAAS